VQFVFLEEHKLHIICRDIETNVLAKVIVEKIRRSKSVNMTAMPSWYKAEQWEQCGLFLQERNGMTKAELRRRGVAALKRASKELKRLKLSAVKRQERCETGGAELYLNK
jgi:hypothetical protein